MDDIREFVLELIQSEYSIEGEDNLDEFNFVDSGFIDSIGLLAFMSDLEAEYGITFTDEELNSSEFRVIGTLVEMIKNKIDG